MEIVDWQVNSFTLIQEIVQLTRAERLQIGLGRRFMAQKS